jgi:hypothetical protein
MRVRRIMKKLLKSKRRGTAIPLAVVAIIILLAMGVGLLSLGFNGRVFSMRTASDIAARCAADAGLTMALFEMNQKLQDKPFKEGTLPFAMGVKLPYSDQVCSYRVMKNFAGDYTIMSFGESGQARRSVWATIGLQGAFDHAILTKGNLVLKSGTEVDAYNSANPGDPDLSVSIGSMSTANDSVVLNNGVGIDGDVFAGGDLDIAIKDLGAKIAGGKYVSAPIALPEVTAPALPVMGAIAAKAETKTITPADNGVYTSIKLNSTGPKLGILEISGGDVVLHVTGNINLGNLCEIVVKGDATLTIYIDGDIVSGLGSGINTEAPPEQAATFQLYATGEGPQDFDIKAKSEFTGVIYAPNANVDLYANGDAYGSVVADSFEFKSGGNFKYDKALKEKNDVDDEAVQFVVTRWYESPPRLATSDLMSEPIGFPVK